MLHTSYIVVLQNLKRWCNVDHWIHLCIEGICILYIHNHDYEYCNVKTVISVLIVTLHVLFCIGNQLANLTSPWIDIFSVWLFQGTFKFQCPHKHL